jgi:uncharacterized lipoprotein YmbA
MIMIVRRNFLVAACGLGVALLAGCGHSDPTQFYDLHSVAPQAGVRAASGLPLRIAHVEVPGAYDRPEIVREQEGNQLKVDDVSHWAAPLGQLMRGALVENLIKRLPNGQIVPAEAPKPAALIEISVEIVAMHETANSLSIQANWTQTRTSTSDGGATTVQSASFSVPMANRSDGAYAESLSQALAQLADAIVGRLGG